MLQFKEVQLPEVVPLEQKFFTNDVFSIDDTTKKVKLEHSTTRISQSIPGVLVLKTTKTYGRSNGRLLYKVVPDDKRLPAFLIPYEMKHMGFSKVFVNLYVTFTYVKWEDKHPQGSLQHVIGAVDVLDHFYEYQLYCKSLNTSIQKFTKDTSKALKIGAQEEFIENIMLNHPTIQDRTNIHVFTIDPPKSVDFDDGFSIKNNKVSIYIANVSVWLDTLNLWDSFSRRISTIYLPDRKRPMLPTILSDCLCSLQEKHTRFAFFMDIEIDEETGEIKDIQYGNCTVRVRKNYCYEDPKLLLNDDYNQLLEMTRKMSKKYKYIQTIRNSHDLVAYLMTFMNYQCAKQLLARKNGIFRASAMKPALSSVPDNLPEEVGKFIKIWNSSGGTYLDASATDNLRHDLMDMDAYVHITSPIRRLVDLLNLIQLQQNLGFITLSSKASEFYQKWTSEEELEYINVTMRSIRKVQNDCSLLDLYVNNPEKMDPLYEGFIFDKIERNDGLFQYSIYLPEIKMMSRTTIRENLHNYEKRLFKLYLFNDEENLKKKIRLQLIS